jgi:hypothetical protein
MDSNLNRILKVFEELKGQFVITESWEVERLVAIGGDEQDYYYVTYNGRETKWNTCVGKLVRLKNKIDDEDYHKFIRLAKINHFDQENLWIPKGEEQKEKCRESWRANNQSRVGQKRSSYNSGLFKKTVWINNGEQRKRVPESDINDWVSNGWMRGHMKGISS